MIKFQIEKLNKSNFSKMRALLMKDNCILTIGDRPKDSAKNKELWEMDGNEIANHKIYEQEPIYVNHKINIYLQN